MKPLIFWIFAGLAASFAFSPAGALDDPSEKLSNPALELQAERIGEKLRCLVCQNENIEESSAPLARSLRRAIRLQLTAGKNAAEITGWAAEKYGGFILLSPELSAQTLLLWGAPFLLLLGGCGLIFLHSRRKKTAKPGQTRPLSPGSPQPDEAKNPGPVLLAVFLLTGAGWTLHVFSQASEKTPFAAAVPPQASAGLRTALNHFRQETEALPPSSEKGAQLARLGALELQAGLPDRAEKSWEQALALHFTPELALGLAEIKQKQAHRITPDILKLYQAALDASSPQARWRVTLEERLADARRQMEREKAEGF